MDTSLITLIVIGIAAMLVLALGVIAFVVMYQRKVINHQVELERINKAKQQELLQASIQSEEEERARIASELHDDIGATLSSVRLFLLNAASEAPHEYLDVSKQLLDDSIGKLRDISHKLQPATLFHLGLQLSIQSMADVINKSGTMHMEYIAINDVERLDSNIELSVYRILQELINNNLKHANATQITITTDRQPNELIVTLAHNGAGLTQENYEGMIYKKGALGLKNIENRIKSINANIYFSKEDGEYVTTLTVPLLVESN